MKLIVGNRIGSALGISSLATLALVLVSGCIVEPNGRAGFEAGVVVAPPPAVVVVVPDDYYWDGYEYVGIVGGQYYYLGPRNVWLVCEPFRIERFHGWERGHPDWRAHAVHNDRYRNDGQGHHQPGHDKHGKKDQDER